MNYQNKSIIFFDGVCVLCNASVLLILKYDKKKYFYFSTLQSDVSKFFLLHVPENILKKDTIILWDNGKLYSESSAVLKIAYQLGGFWYITQIFWIVPAFLRNAIYRLISRNRYIWFGKKDQCIVPDENLKSRFLI